MEVFHIDRGEIVKHEFTQEGYLNCVLRIARVGELKYFNADGSERIEVVTPEVLFEKDSIQSFKAKPITLDHPPVRVDSENARHYQRGLTSPYAIIDGDFLGIVASITDKETIDEITSGRRKECSCGYDAEIEPIGDGKYRQVRRRGNHVAIVERGRAGSEVRVMLDSADVWEGEKITDSNENSALDNLSLDSIKKTYMKTFKLDGIEFSTEDLDLVKHAKSIDKELIDLRKKGEGIPELVSKVDSLTKEADVIKGRADGLETANKALKADLEAAEVKATEAATKLDSVTNNDADIEAEISKRIAVWDKVLPYYLNIDAKFKPNYSQKAHEVMKKYMKDMYPDMDVDGMSEDYMKGFFDSMSVKPAKMQDAAEVEEDTTQEMLETIQKSRATKADSSSVLEEAIKKYQQELETAWSAK